MLLNPKQQSYAEKVAAGMHPATAYGEAFGASSPGVCRKGASRMSQNDSVNDEIRRIREKAEVLAGGAVMTVLEKRLFLAEIKRTPLSQINENSVLCQELTRTKPFRDKSAVVDVEGEQLELWVTEKIKKPDVLRAIELDSKLAGDFSEDKKNDAEAALATDMRTTLANLRKRKQAS